MPPTRRNTAKRGLNDGPQPMDPTDKYAPTAWLSSGVGSTEELELPSTQLCLVRRPGVEGLVKAGVLRNMDSLSALVNEAHIKRVQGPKGAEDHVDMASIMADDKQMTAIADVVDKVVCYCVVRPEVYRTPDDATRRVPGVVYADMIDLLDKMYIFNYVVGGTRDLESFRGQLSGVLGGVEVEPDVPAATE